MKNISFRAIVKKCKFSSIFCLTLLNFSFGQKTTLMRVRALNAGIPKDSSSYVDAKTFGANTLRLFFDVSDTSVTIIEKELKKAQAAGLKVILVSGSSIYDSIPDTQSSKFWDQPSLVDDYAILWKTIAKRLLPYSNTIYAYDIWNEPYNASLSVLAP